MTPVGVSSSLKPDSHILEVTDHLGNVRISLNADPTRTSRIESIQNYTNYYAFGGPQPGRYYNAPGYHFGFNGQEKDDALLGDGAITKYAEREYDNRLGRWYSIDPIAGKFPNESPYLFAGNNPVFFIDQKGKKKTVYTIYEHEGSKNAVIQTTTTSDLMSHAYTSFYSGIKMYDWYDYSEVNVVHIANNGKITTVSSGPIQGKYRATTLANSELGAEAIAYTWSLSGFEETKEEKGHDGLILTTKNKLFPGNQNNLNATGRGQLVNIDGILSAISVANTASSTDKIFNFVDAIKYAREGILAGSDAQELAPIDVKKVSDKLTGKAKKQDTTQCKCGKDLIKTDTNGQTTAIPVPANKKVTDYPAAQ